MSFQMDHKIHQGDTFLFEMAFYESDDVTPVDVSTWEFFFTVKPEIDSDDTDLLNSYIKVDPVDVTVDEDVVGSGTTNRVSFSVSDIVTAAIPVGTHLADFQAINGTIVETQGAGTFVVTPQVTRRVS